MRKEFFKDIKKNRLEFYSELNKDIYLPIYQAYCHSLHQKPENFTVLKESNKQKIRISLNQFF